MVSSFEQWFGKTVVLQLNNGGKHACRFGELLLRSLEVLFGFASQGAGSSMCINH